MAQVAVSKDGTELIGKFLIRGLEDAEDCVVLPKEQSDTWINPYLDSVYGQENIAIELPKGTIKKLIGRDLTWEDEPVELL